MSIDVYTTRRKRHLIAVGMPLAAWALTLLAAASPVSAQTGAGPCRVLAITGPGPWDYRTHAQHPRVKLMEDNHFRPQTEALMRGTSQVEIAPDLEFVFRYTPNHHRALVALVRLAERQKTDRPRGAQYTVRCHFERAIDFRPDDAVARVMFGDYLLRTGAKAEGLAQLQMAREQNADNAFTQYNIGLVYAERGEFELALRQAHAAAALGFTRTELRKLLESAGRWRDPEPKATP